MTHMRSEEEGHWPKFVEYCEEYGVDLKSHEDWFPWWECWNAALDAADAVYMNQFGQGEEFDSEDPVVL